MPPDSNPMIDDYARSLLHLCTLFSQHIGNESAVAMRIINPIADCRGCEINIEADAGSARIHAYPETLDEGEEVLDFIVCNLTRYHGQCRLCPIVAVVLSAAWSLDAANAILSSRYIYQKLMMRSEFNKLLRLCTRKPETISGWYRTRSQILSCTNTNTRLT